MKKLVFASLIGSLFALSSLAQTPAPPKRQPTAAKPAPAEDLQLKKALDLLKDKPAQRAA